MAGDASWKQANDLIDFLNASPSPHHTVQSIKARLEGAGFQLIRERDDWNHTLCAGGKYYLTRNGSTIVAFSVGRQWLPGSSIAMVATHTDSPCLRVKPQSKRTGEGYLQIGVEAYGSGTWHTWFDRDLGIAGQVMVRGEGGEIRQKLAQLAKPVCRIPSLAVHFGGSAPFDFNTETHLLPIAGLVSAELNRKSVAQNGETEEGGLRGDDLFKKPAERHHPYLIELLALEIGCEPDAILDFELVLYDTQPACLGGFHDEFVFSARLDNHCMTYCAVEGLLQSLAGQSSSTSDNTVRLIACFDNEEIGSTSMQGAGSNMMSTILRRLCSMPWTKEPESDQPLSTAYEQSLSRSFIVSADMEHAINPNYSSNYEDVHRARMNEGTVIKVNANQHYATNSPGIVLIQECARRAKAASFQSRKTPSEDSAGVPLQMSVMRNDAACGSTNGPILAAKLGVRTVDVGNSQLSMHSIRETAGAGDVEHGVNLLTSFFEHYEELEGKVMVD